MEKTNNQIQIKASDEVIKGFYSNNVMITHTDGEFMIDFISIFPPHGVLGSRIIISPSHAKRILVALKDNISKFEAKFGEIKEAAHVQIPDEIKN